MSQSQRADPAADVPPDTPVLVATSRGVQRDVFHKRVDDADDGRRTACKCTSVGYREYTVAEAREQGFDRGCTNCYGNPRTGKHPGGTPKNQTCPLCGKQIKGGRKFPTHVEMGNCDGV